jgi:hypothetical protein
MPNGPDFSDVTSEQAAEALAAAGHLEKMFLLPPEFGGQDIPPNYVYVPVGLADVKRRLDLETIAPLVSDGQITQYAATPEYEGRSFIPNSVTIVASEPASFTARIAIWGDALAEQ